MTKTVRQSAGQNGAKYPKEARLRGPLTRMTHDQPTAPRQGRVHGTSWLFMLGCGISANKLTELGALSG